MMEESKRVSKQEMLASVSVDLAQFVGKVHEESTLPITSGRIKNGQILVMISVVTIPHAREIGIDPRQLLDGVPSEFG